MLSTIRNWFFISIQNSFPFQMHSGTFFSLNLNCCLKLTAFRKTVGLINSEWKVEWLENAEWFYLIKVKYFRFENADDEKEAWNLCLSTNIPNSFADHIPICCSFFQLCTQQNSIEYKKERKHAKVCVSATLFSEQNERTFHASFLPFVGLFLFNLFESK